MFDLDDPFALRSMYQVVLGTRTRRGCAARLRSLSVPHYRGLIRWNFLAARKSSGCPCRSI